MADGVAWQLADVLDATGGRTRRLDGPRCIAAVSTDTRSLTPGAAFVALRGPNHDGHAYVGEAVRRGAAALIVEAAAGCSVDGAPVTVVEVPDTLRALGDLAAHHRRRRALTVAAITGSNGKTTTKEMLASIMTHALGRGSVLTTRGTENNLIGVPLTLLRASGEERVAVLELGMNARGEIWRLAEIADPDVGVVTCVAPAHIEGLGSIEGVARAKGELYARLRSRATAVVNNADERVKEIAGVFTGRTLCFGPGGDVRAEEVTSQGTDGIAFTLVAGDASRRVRVPLPGIHNVTNALAAATTAVALGASVGAIVAGLEALPPLPLRMQVEVLPGSVTVINDAYNANPASMRSALAMLASTGGTGARIAVLGEMRELGPESAALHREVGRAAAEHGVSLLVILGPEADAVRAGGVEGGLDPEVVVIVGSHDEAAAVVRERLRPGDCVLIKGSRGARMEDVLERLRA
jgi:UDP-N-acetylmuramoyl-tripeptide--D-alanyl-D-alanine ligase